MNTWQHLRKEAGELAKRLGLSPKQFHSQAFFVHILVLAVFGAVLPLRKGLDFFDPLILSAYACLGALFAAPAAAAPFALPSLGAANARIAVCVAYGEFMALAMIALGAATLYVSHWNGPFFPPALDLLITSATFGFLLSITLSTVSLWLALRFSSGTSKLLLRLIFLGLLASILWRGPGFFLGFVWSNSMVVLAAGIASWLALRSTIFRQAIAPQPPESA